MGGQFNQHYFDTHSRKREVEKDEKFLQSRETKMPKLLFVQKFDAEREKNCFAALKKLSEVSELLYLGKYGSRMTRNMSTAEGAIRKARKYLKIDIAQQVYQNTEKNPGRLKLRCQNRECTDDIFVESSDENIVDHVLTCQGCGWGGLILVSFIR